MRSHDDPSSQSMNPPTPVFIQQSSKQITYVKFSRQPKNQRPILYSGNRDGDLVIYDCTHRRPIFSSNTNKQPVLTIIESADLLISHTRNGRLFKWTGADLSNLKPQCKRKNQSILTLNDRNSLIKLK